MGWSDEFMAPEEEDDDDTIDDSPSNQADADPLDDKLCTFTETQKDFKQQHWLVRSVRLSTCLSAQTYSSHVAFFGCLAGTTATRVR